MQATQSIPAKMLSLTANNKSLDIVANGSWTSANAAKLEAQLFDPTTIDLEKMALGRSILRFDVTNVSELDTFGAWLLQRFRREAIEKGFAVQFVGMKADSKTLFDELADVNQAPKNAVSENANNRRVGHNSFGVILNTLVNELASMFVMFGAVLATIVKTIKNPREFRVTSFIDKLDKVAWSALPIVLLVTFIMGAIIAQQGYFHFRKFGADLYVIDMVGFLLMREIGVLMVAIVVAGRSGSAYTAELGSMKMREEVDALQTMGYDPLDVLILPRVLALIVALPILTFIGSMAAFFGAGIVSIFYADLSLTLFLERLNEAVTMDHFLVGMIKAPFMGAVIGIIACNEGLSVRGSTASLGKHTTQSVVRSIFMVIAFDGIFTVFFSAIGM